MNIAFIVLFLLVSSYSIQIAKLQQSGFNSYPFATPIICLFIHLVLLVMSVWYCGWIFGVVLFACDFFGITEAVFGWILSIPDMLIKDEERYYKYLRLEFAFLIPSFLVSFAFCIISFFTVSFRSLYTYATENKMFLIIAGIIVLISIVIRIVVNKKFSAQNEEL